MGVPAGLRFSRDHEWVRVEGERARIGVTEQAQAALGNVVFVGLPSVGEKISAGARVGEIESMKSVSEVYAPISGVVVAVNDALVASPELLNGDPYGEGWLYEVTGFDPLAVEALLDAEAYRTLLRP